MLSGIEAISIINRANPNIKLIVNTTYDSSEVVFEALCSGAAGYITKNTSASELLDAIDKVINGGAPMSSKIAKMVIESFQKILTLLFQNEKLKFCNFLRLARVTA